VTGGAELTGLVVNEGDDFPEPARHAHAEAHRVVVLEEWAREDGNPHAIGAGVTQRVILEAEPDARVEWLHLRHGIGHVHGVVPAAIGHDGRTPHRILATRHVPAAEPWRVAVALVADLRRARDARV